MVVLLFFLLLSPEIGLRFQRSPGLTTTHARRRPFPTRRLTATDGFIGLDGAFRFGQNGVVERAMEVREVRQGEVVVADAAPSRFGD